MGADGHTTATPGCVGALPRGAAWAGTARSRGAELTYPLAESGPPDVGEPRESVSDVALVAVVDDQRSALHQRIRHEAPVAAVVRVVAVVAEHEEVAPRHDQRPPVVARRVVPDARGRAPHEIVALPAEF